MATLPSWNLPGGMSPGLRLLAQAGKLSKSQFTALQLRGMGVLADATLNLALALAPYDMAASLAARSLLGATEAYGRRGGNKSGRLYRSGNRTAKCGKSDFTWKIPSSKIQAVIPLRWSKSGNYIFRRICRARTKFGFARPCKG